MAALEMSHGIHLMTWCATFLEACKRFDELLIPVYNAMVTMDLKQEERDKLFQANNIFTMKLITDLQPIMLNRLQRTVDKDGQLVSETYRLAQQTANDVRKLETPTANRFVESLHLDNNGTLLFTESINNSDHLLRLSDSHKPARGKSEDKRLASVKEKIAKINTDVLNNIYQNLTEQIGGESYNSAWSGTDLAEQECSIEERVAKLDSLLNIFANKNVHEGKKYVDSKETQLTPFKWRENSVFLHYLSTLSCSVDELSSEIRLAWPSVSRLYLKSYQEIRGKPNQRSVWKQFLCSADNGIMYPNMYSLIMILKSTLSNTSPLERSYLLLEMICSPPRNQVLPEHFELLHLLKALNLPVKNSAEYADAIELLSEGLVYKIDS